MTSNMLTSPEKRTSRDLMGLLLEKEKKGSSSSLKSRARTLFASLARTELGALATSIVLTDYRL